MKLSALFFAGVFVPTAIGMIAMVAISIAPFFNLTEQWLKPAQLFSISAEADTAVILTRGLGDHLETLFDKADNQIRVLENFASAAINSRLPVQTPFPTYFAVPGLYDNPADAVVPRDVSNNPLNGVVFNVGVNSLSDFHQLPYLNATSIIDSVSRAICIRGGVFTKSFIGIGDLFRRYPALNLTNYNTDQFDCGGTIVTGFRARCRLWYTQVVNTRNLTVFSEPYQDAVTKQNRISVSRAITWDNGTFVGSAAADLDMVVIDKLIKDTRVLGNGYTFLLSSSGKVVSHPLFQRIPDTADPPVTSLEYEAWSSLLQAGLSPALANTSRVFSGSFTKNGAKWFLSWRGIKFARYVVVTEYPEEDVQQPFSDLRASVNKSNITAIVIMLLVVTFAALILFRTTASLTKRILGPITELTQKLEEMTQLNLDVELGVQAPASAELEVLHENFRHVLTAVRFGNDAYYGGNMQKALQNYADAEQLMQRMNNLRGLGVCWNNRANVLKSLGRVQEAEDLYRRSIDNARQLLQMAEAREAEAKAIDGKRGNDEEAANITSTKFRSQGMAAKVVLANRTMNLGVLYKDKREFQLADSSLRQSMDLQKETDNALGIAKVSANLAQMHMEMGSLDRAEELLKDTLETMQERHDEIGLQHVYCTLGLLYRRKGDLEAAKHNFKTALETFERIDASVQQICLANMYEILRKDGEEKGADEMKKMISVKAAMAKKVVFVLDVSGSMAGNSIRQCRESICDILENYIDNDDWVRLLRFNNVVSEVFPWTKKEGNLQALIDQVKLNTPTGGATAFYDAVLSAITEEKQTPTGPPLGSNALWVVSLTDGEDNSSNGRSLNSCISTLGGPTFFGTFVAITVGILKNEQDVVSMVKAANRSKGPDGSSCHIKVGDGGQSNIGQAFKQVAKMLAGQVNVEIL